MVQDRFFQRTVAALRSLCILTSHTSHTSLHGQWCSLVLFATKKSLKHVSWKPKQQIHMQFLCIFPSSKPLSCSYSSPPKKNNRCFRPCPENPTAAELCGLIHQINWDMFLGWFINRRWDCINSTSLHYLNLKFYVFTPSLLPCFDHIV